MELKQLIRTLVALILTIVLLPGVLLVLCVIVLIFYPYKRLIQLLALVFRPSLRSMVEGAYNTLYATNEPSRTTVNLCVYLVVDGRVSLSQVRSRFQQSILGEFEGGRCVYERLKQTITKFMGYSFFQDAKNFDLNFHVRAYSPPAAIMADGLGGTTEERDLNRWMERICEDIISQPWTPGTSNWELLVLEDFKSRDGAPEQTMLIIRINHYLSDGFGMNGFVNRLMDSTEEVAGQSKKPLVNKRCSGKKGGGFWKTMMLPLSAFWDLGYQLAGIPLRSSGWSTPGQKQGPPELTTVFTSAMPMEKIKDIKNAHRVAYNSVLLAVLAAALHRLSAKLDKGMPGKILCVLPLPKPGHPGGLTNHHAGAFMALPVVERATPTALKDVDAAYRESVRSSGRVLLEFIMWAVSLMPTCLARIFYSFLKPTLAIGIFPVITTPWHFYGGKVSHAIAVLGSLTPPASSGLTATMGGGNRLQRITLTINKALLRKPEVYQAFADYVDQEIDRLYEMIEDIEMIA